MFICLCFSTQGIAKPLTDMEKAQVVIAHKGNDSWFYITLINNMYN